LLPAEYGPEMNIKNYPKRIYRSYPAPARSSGLQGGRFRGGSAGFSLVEVLVVVAIVTVLMTFATIAVNGMIDSSRANDALALMQTIENAIAEFVQEAPLAGENEIMFKPTATDQVTYNQLFGPYPPTPTASFAPNDTMLGVYGPSDEEDPQTLDKMWRLALIGWGSSKPKLTSSNSAANYASIESLVLFLTRFSPRARDMIEKMPEGRLTNLDQDLMYLDANDNGTLDTDETGYPLREISDSWKQPLRYSFQLTPTGPRYELRSAGPDGEFAPAWSPEEDSDDIVLVGP
jgi:prepilin-type N-terminal cleavage/methylation domain-containing protein